MKIDTPLVVRFRLNAYWHLDFVLIAAPVPESRPATKPMWIQGRYFPSFSTTDWIYRSPLPLLLQHQTNGGDLSMTNTKRFDTLEIN